MRYKTPLLIAALAVAALALPAVASALEVPWSVIPVPAGEVQHTVTQTTFVSNETVPGVTPWSRTQENWASANAARSIETNTDNGELLSEYTATQSSQSGYIVSSNTLTETSELGGAASYSWQTEGSKIKLQISRGWLRKTGATTYLGRPADIYTETGAQNDITVVADAATDYPLEETTQIHEGKQTATQVSKVTVFESLSLAAAAADLAPREHPGATVSRVRSRSGKRSGKHSKALAKHKRHGKRAKKSAAQR